MNFAYTKLSRPDEHRLTWDGTSLYAAKAPYHAHLEGNYQVENFASNIVRLTAPTHIPYTTANVKLSVMICQTTLWQ